jgi:hypothetical protein
MGLGSSVNAATRASEAARSPSGEVLAKSFLRPSLVLLLICVFMPVTSAHATIHPSAVKQSIRITSISEHCLDEFDEEEIIYIIEGAKVCKISVRVQGRGSTKSKVALEYYDSDEGWTKSDWKTQTTNTSGRVTFTHKVNFPNQPGGFCYTGDSYSYRFAIAKAGRFKAFRSSSFEISYSSAENNPACLESDSDDDYEYE